MPFKPTGKKKKGKKILKSPSGREFNEDQVRLYYATEGFTKPSTRKKNKLRRPK